MRKIVVTGCRGQVGRELAASLKPLGKIFAFGREELDLADRDRMRQVIAEIKPDVIVNSAAYTAVDKAESDEEAAFEINAEAPAILAETAESLGSLLVHYSTDYVFDGSSSLPYREQDKVNPLNTYGRTKLAGERAVEALCSKHLILRTSWVYADRGKNFLLTMLRLGAEKEMLRIVDDQYGAPTWSRLIAVLTARMLEAVLSDQGTAESKWGVYHLTCAGKTSWHGFAEEIFNRAAHLAAKEGHAFHIPRLEPIATDEYPLPAKRPSNSVLSNRKLFDAFGLQMPEWKEALHECMNTVNLPFSQSRQTV